MVSKSVLPILNELADCQTDADRARWLHRLPLWLIHREYNKIRLILDLAEFRTGRDFINAAVALTSATRDDEGFIPLPVMMEFQKARLALTDVIQAPSGEVR